MATSVSRGKFNPQMEATKASVKPGEFAGVELTFMGANTSGVHNVLFRAFLTSWEEYTGAKITWIDLVQTDYNPRLMQAVATGTPVRVGSSGTGGTNEGSCNVVNGTSDTELPANSGIGGTGVEGDVLLLK